MSILTKHRPRRDEALIPVASASPVAVPERPRGVAASPLPPLALNAPARSVGVLAELRADDAPVDPRALRRAFDSGTWLPLPIRTVQPDAVVSDEDRLSSAIAELILTIDETFVADPRYAHRVFLAVDKANHAIDTTATCIVRELNDTYWSVTTHINTLVAALDEVAV